MVIEIGEVVVGRISSKQVKRVVFLENIRDVAGVEARLEKSVVIPVFLGIDDSDSGLQRIEVSRATFVGHVGLDSDYHCPSRKPR